MLSYDDIVHVDDLDVCYGLSKAPKTSVTSSSSHDVH